MRRNLQIFLLFSKYALKTTLAQPMGTFFFFIGKLLRFATQFLFVFYLLSNTNILAGYNLNQTLIFFLTFNVIDTTSQLLFREVYRFRPLVVSGELNSILIKPYHPFLRVLIGGVDLIDLITLLLYASLLLFFVLQVLPLTLLNIILFGILMVNGLLITTAFHIVVLALGIFTTEVDHTIMIYRDIARIGALPVDIYQQPIRFFFTFILPVGIMMTFPVKSLFGQLSPYLVVISILISTILFTFSLYLWNSALKKYQSWGG